MAFIVVNSTVRNTAIKTDKRNGETYYQFKGVPVVRDGAVMNGLLYDAKDNAAGMDSISDKVITYRHPVANGKPVDAYSKTGLQEHYIGGHIINKYLDGDIWRVDFEVKKSLADTQSPELVKRIENREDIGVSTGLLTKIQAANGKAFGKEYTGKATKQVYNHLAMLPSDEPPAGGDDTVIRFNGEDEKVITINADEWQEIEDDKPSKSLINKLADALSEKFAISNKNTDNLDTDPVTNQLSGDKVEKIEDMKAALKKGGKLKDNMSEDDIKSAYANMSKEANTTDNGKPRHNSDETQAAIQCSY